jgi:hypothetical protein
MAKKRSDLALYFTNVARAGKQSVLLTGSLYAFEGTDNYQTVIMTLIDGNWRSVTVTGIAYSAKCLLASGGNGREYFVLERNRGLYRIKPSAGVKFSIFSPKRQGFTMDLKRIGNKWFVVGGHRQILAGDGQNWKGIDEGVYVAGSEGDVKILNSIDGFSESDVYTVGMNGQIFHYNGEVWKQLDSPTSSGFKKVLCAEDGEVYICGSAAGLYRGNASRWLALTEVDEDTVFWDMAMFRGKIYVCGGSALSVINESTLEKVNIPLDGPFSFYHIDTDDDEMWVCGDECLLQFDGQTWTRYIYPENI